MGPLRSVVLAGGGTGGHIYPLLAFADCLRRHDPGVRITCLGTPKGLENELIPPAGYDLRHDPGLPAAPLGQPGPDAYPGPDVEGGPRRRQGDRRGRAPTWSSASAGTSRCPATWPPGGARLPIVIHEVNVPPGVANRLGMKFTKNVAVGFPHQPAQAEALRDARVVGVPLRRGIAGLDRHAAARRRPRALRAPPRPAGALRRRWLAGRPVDQPGGRRRGQGAGPRRRAGAARDGRPQRAGADPHRPAGAVRGAALPVRDGAGLRRRRPDARPGRGDDLRRGGRHRAAHHLRAATRTATRSRSATRCPWWRPAAGCWSTTPS